MNLIDKHCSVKNYVECIRFRLPGLSLVCKYVLIELCEGIRFYILFIKTSTYMSV